MSWSHKKYDGFISHRSRSAEEMDRLHREGMKEAQQEFHGPVRVLVENGSPTCELGENLLARKNCDKIHLNVAKSTAGLV